ncbi:MAG: alpha/beta hydrolase [Aliishimia sp.]
MIAWADSARGHLRARGKALEYQCLGPAPNDSPTLVLLHEGLGCLALWRDFPARLQAATGLGVFVYSRQGYGHSDPANMPRPLDYMTREAVDVLPEVLDAIGFQQGVLIGHSDGATIAALHAGYQQDQRVTGVVLIAPHFFTESKGLAAITSARQAFETGDLARKLGKYHRDAAHSFAGWCDSWLHPDFVAWNATDALDNIRVPILTVQGDADPYGSLAQIMVVEDRAPGAVTQLVLEAVGHTPHLEQLEDVVARIHEFIRKMNYNT